MSVFKLLTLQRQLFRGNQQNKSKFAWPWTVVCFTAYALVMPAVAHETPSVLPQGISRARIVHMLTDDINGSFDSEGKPQGITQSLNRSLTMKDFIAAQPALGDLAAALNAVQNGLGDELLNTNLYSDFQVKARVLVPAYEYGVSPKFTLGIKVPIINKTVSHRFQADAINNATAAVEAMGDLVNSNPAVQAGLEQVKNLNLGTEAMVSNIFTSKGYSGPADFERSYVGDVELGGKYQYLKNEQWVGSVTFGVRLPTGTPESLNNPFDSGSGTGATGVGMYFDHSYDIGSTGFSVGAMTKGLYSFKDTRQRAVPLSEEDSLPSLLAADGQVQDVTRHIGLRFESQLWTAYEFWEKQLEVYGAYEFQRKAQDSYSGPNPEQKLRYDLLEKGSDTMAQNLLFGAEFTTIPMFRQKKFFMPMALNAFYSFPVLGKNSTIGPFTRVDLKVFF